MDRDEFERDLGAWIDGALPPERRAEMQAAADASPELAERAATERRFHARVAKAMASDFARDEDVDEAVRAMIARARSGRVPARRLLGMPRAAWRAVAATLLVATVGAWWFCLPPFECKYMAALEAASHDHAATPGPEADELATRFRLPDELDGAKAAPPAALTRFEVVSHHLLGVRLDYVRPDGATAFHVVACESTGFKPSSRRLKTRDGSEWWTRDHGGNCTWVFQTAETEVVYAVTGPDADEASIYAAATELRARVR